MNTIGNRLKLTSYGESHGELIGAVLDGMVPGFTVDRTFIQNQLERRRPGQSEITTTRNEADLLIINSGVFNGKTTGAPINIQIANTNQKPSDYKALSQVYRPSHADYTYQAKYGIRDCNGGGRSSARVTSGWVAGGALVQDWLQQNNGVRIGAYVKQIGSTRMLANPAYYSNSEVDKNAVRCPDYKTALQMEETIKEAIESKDSLGGIIECVVTGLKAGIGDPVFDKLNANLAKAMFGINAVKGVEFGGGFEMSTKYGSEVNDAFINDNEEIKTSSNFSGGIQGGISNGMDVVFRVAFKPTSTIGKQQETVDIEGNNTVLEAKGRHDPCVVPRAVPVVETMAALVLGDLII